MDLKNNIEEAKLIQSFLDFVSTDLAFQEYKQLVCSPDYCRSKIPSEIDLGPFIATSASKSEIVETFNVFTPLMSSRLQEASEKFKIVIPCSSLEDVSFWLKENILCTFLLAKKHGELFGMVKFVRSLKNLNRLYNSWHGRFGREELLAGRVLHAYMLFNPKMFAISSIGHRRFKKLGSTSFRTRIEQNEVTKDFWEVTEKLKYERVYEDEEISKTKENILVNLYTVKKLKENYSSYDEVLADLQKLGLSK